MRSVSQAGMSCWLDVLGHELRVDLVDVLEAHDDRVRDALRIRWSLGREPKAEHS